VKAAGGNSDHMVAYFLLVMGDAPSLWLNNLLAGSITYNRPGNAFNLGRVTVKPNERLHDYTNRFFENRNRCQGRPGCCQVKEGCQGSQDL
jgi:hypothetical protein